MVVFCSGPYTAPDFEGVERNLDMASEAAKEVLRAGHTPIVPHKITAYFDLDPEFQEWGEREWLTKVCFPMLDRCDAIYLYPGWLNSSGARKEREYAIAHGKVIALSMSDLGEG